MCRRLDETVSAVWALAIGASTTRDRAAIVAIASNFVREEQIWLPLILTSSHRPKPVAGNTWHTRGHDSEATGEALAFGVRAFALYLCVQDTKEWAKECRQLSERHNSAQGEGWSSRSRRRCAASASSKRAGRWPSSFGTTSAPRNSSAAGRSPTPAPTGV